MKTRKPARFEDAMARLQEIVTALEDLYKEGAACARFCREQLEKARHEISVWQEGEAVPFTDRPCAGSGTHAGEEDA